MFRLVKSGYGTLSEVRQMDARTVQQILHYESFLNNFERAYIELHRGDK